VERDKTFFGAQIADVVACAPYAQIRKLDIDVSLIIKKVNPHVLHASQPPPADCDLGCDG